MLDSWRDQLRNVALLARPAFVRSRPAGICYRGPWKNNRLEISLLCLTAMSSSSLDSACALRLNLVRNIARDNVGFSPCASSACSFSMVGS